MRATLFVVLAGLSGCGVVTSEFDGHRYVSRGEVLSVDGVDLPHRRWVPLDVPAGTDALRMASATEDMTLSGSADGAGHLEVQLFSEVEGDGEARLEGGAVVVSSAAGKKVVANGARGTLAPGMRLEITTGTGDQRLDGLADLVELRCDTGTGDLWLASCGAADVRIQGGTGDVHVEGLTGSRLEVDSGTGDVSVAGSRVEALDVSTGTGDVSFRDCTAARTEVESGTGDVLLQGRNELGTPSYELGTGKVRDG